MRTLLIYFFIGVFFRILGKLYKDLFISPVDFANEIFLSICIIYIKMFWGIHIICTGIDLILVVFLRLSVCFRCKYSLGFLLMNWKLV